MKKTTPKTKTRKAPVLKLEREVVLTVNYRELEGFIQFHTGREDYDIVSCEEWSNDSQHHVIVKGEPTTYETKEFNAFCSGSDDGSYRLHAILETLAQRGLLEPAAYNISVCW